MSKENDDSSSDIKRMSSLLLSGATMLADTCPDCKVPLFKKNENTFCPKCGRKAIFVSSDDEIRQIEHTQSFSETCVALQDIFTGKLNYLANKLAACEEFEEMKIILQIMDLLLDLTIKITRVH